MSIFICLYKEQNMTSLFHKLGDQVVMGPYKRECTLQADVNTSK